MIVKNPTDTRLEVIIKGVRYSVEAKSSVDNVPEEAAIYWKGLQNFIEVSPETKSTKTVEEKIEEVKKEIEEVETEEVKEDIKKVNKK